MRLFGVALLSGTVMLGACGGGESQSGTATASAAMTRGDTGGCRRHARDRHGPRGEDGW